MADHTQQSGRLTPETAAHQPGHLQPDVAIAPQVAPVTPLAADHHHHNNSTVPEYNSDIEKEKTGEKTGLSAEVDSHSGNHTNEHVAPVQQRWYHKLGPVYRYRKPLFQFFIGGLFTGWWMASLILHRNDKNWVIPFLLWLAIMLRLVTYYVPTRLVMKPVRLVWENTVVRATHMIPAKFRTLVGAIGAFAVILVGSFASEEAGENTRENRAISIFGLIVILFVFWGTSKHRSRINWQTVIVGMLAQYIIALFILRTQVGIDVFGWIATHAAAFLAFGKDGVAFLTNREIADLGMFFFGVIPAIIFFISVVAVLYHIGFLQWFIQKMAVFVFWLMGVSGAEAVVAAATPFIGQGESAMLVRPFIPHMTKAELHQVMTCGFATISGSVLGGYIIMGLNANVLISSCIMSIPASLAISKLRYPEVEETLTAGRVVIPEDAEEKAENALHAFANGALLGIRIAGSIIASLICILALVGLVNALLTWWGSYLDINDPKLTLQTIFGYLFFPVAFLLGASRDKTELLAVGRLIAEKVITNEFVAFLQLSTPPGEVGHIVLSDRARLIASYAVCGFGNIGSLGIQIGILSQLAPSRGGDVARLAFSALVSGVFATLTSAAVAGMVITNQQQILATPS